jgi:hypothetical protein
VVVTDEEHHIRVAPDVALHVLVHRPGRPRWPAFVLVHGLASNARLWCGAAGPWPAAPAVGPGGSERAFDAALAAGDARRTGQAALGVESLIADWAADTNVSDEVEGARSTLRGMVVRLADVADAGLHDHRDVVAAHVETLLDLRRFARAEDRYDIADRIRDELGRGGVDVRDTPAGVEWEDGPPEAWAVARPWSAVGGRQGRATDLPQEGPLFVGPAVLDADEVAEPGVHGRHRLGGAAEHLQGGAAVHHRLHDLLV